MREVRLLVEDSHHLSHKNKLNFWYVVVVVAAAAAAAAAALLLLLLLLLLSLLSVFSSFIHSLIWYLSRATHVLIPQSCFIIVASKAAKLLKAKLQLLYFDTNLALKCQLEHYQIVSRSQTVRTKERRNKTTRKWHGRILLFFLLLLPVVNCFHNYYCEVYMIKIIWVNCG